MDFLAESEPRVRAAFALRLLAAGVHPRRGAIDEAARAIAAAFAESPWTAGLVAEPAFPGTGAGAATIDGVERAVYAARISVDGTPVGVAFTVLIAGRPAHITLAPPSAAIDAT